MVTREVIVKSEVGLHARPASALVKLAQQCKSRVLLHAQGKQVDAKSMFAVLGAGIKGGAQIMVSAEGEDETASLDKVCELITTMEN